MPECSNLVFRACVVLSSLSKALPQDSGIVTTRHRELPFDVGDERLVFLGDRGKTGFDDRSRIDNSGHPDRIARSFAGHTDLPIRVAPRAAYGIL